MPSEKIDLPPPEEFTVTGYNVVVRAYTADQVKAAILAERERCAKLCETLDHGAFGPSSYLSGIHDGSIGCANAIRKVA